MTSAVLGEKESWWCLLHFEPGCAWSRGSPRANRVSCCLAGGLQQSSLIHCLAGRQWGLSGKFHRGALARGLHLSPSRAQLLGLASSKVTVVVSGAHVAVVVGWVWLERACRCGPGRAPAADMWGSRGGGSPGPRLFGSCVSGARGGPLCACNAVIAAFPAVGRGDSPENEAGSVNIEPNYANELHERLSCRDRVWLVGPGPARRKPLPLSPLPRCFVSWRRPPGVL